jgi:hypothetical protein
MARVVRQEHLRLMRFPDGSLRYVSVRQHAVESPYRVVRNAPPSTAYRASNPAEVVADEMGQARDCGLAERRTESSRRNGGGER